jgi:phosphoglycolate phosphatase
LFHEETGTPLNVAKRDFPGIRALVFDLDGTLIDSKLDLACAVNATLEHMGRKQLDHETIYSFVGNGALKLIALAMGAGVTEAGVQEGMQYFRQYYWEHMLDHTQPYPGVCDGLDLLSGYAMGVLSNKPERFSRAIVERLGMNKYFRSVYGEYSFVRKKPDPIGMIAILSDLGAQPHEALMVGDSEVDILTARNAGTPFCGVAYGIGSETLPDLDPDLMVGSLTELAVYLGATGGVLSQDVAARVSPDLEKLK